LANFLAAFLAAFLAFLAEARNIRSRCLRQYRLRPMRRFGQPASRQIKVIDVVIRGGPYRTRHRSRSSLTMAPQARSESGSTSYGRRVAMSSPQSDTWIDPLSFALSAAPSCHQSSQHPSSQEGGMSFCSPWQIVKRLPFQSQIRIATASEANAADKAASR